MIGLHHLPTPRRPIADALGDWLALQGPEICAVGLGFRERGGRRTAEPVVAVLVQKKRPEASLSPAERVPRGLFGWPTDVRDSGLFRPQTLSERHRPTPGGASIGHFRGESGTMACRAWEPGRAGGLLLSNNHVLTCYDQAAVGDAIIQPSRAALGMEPRDTIARLLRWIPLEMDPPIPQLQHSNQVDAAVAEEVVPGGISPRILGLGAISSWRASDDVPVGLEVVKSGALSGVTWGEVSVIQASARLTFRGIGVSLMRDQMLTSHLTEGGDSGALVVAPHGDGWSAIGLACGASRRFSMVNPIELVQSLLKIQVADRRWDG